MLTAGVLLFDELGRIRTALPPANDFNGGTPTVGNGFLATEPNGEPQVFLGGIGYRENGNVVDTDSPLDPEGVLTNRRGQIRASNGTPSYWYAGLPFTADGQLSTAPLPATLPYAFSNAFSRAFDRQRVV
jgi:hypothetical protein